MSRAPTRRGSPSATIPANRNRNRTTTTSTKPPRSPRTPSARTARSSRPSTRSTRPRSSRTSTRCSPTRATSSKASAPRVPEVRRAAQQPADQGPPLGEESGQEAQGALSKAPPRRRRAVGTARPQPAPTAATAAPTAAPDEVAPPDAAPPAAADADALPDAPAPPRAPAPAPPTAPNAATAARASSRRPHAPRRPGRGTKSRRRGELRGSVARDFADADAPTALSGPLEKRSAFGAWQTRHFWVNRAYLCYCAAAPPAGQAAVAEAAIDLRHPSAGRRRGRAEPRSSSGPRRTGASSTRPRATSGRARSARASRARRAAPSRRRPNRRRHPPADLELLRVPAPRLLRSARAREARAARQDRHVVQRRPGDPQAQLFEKYATTPDEQVIRAEGEAPARAAPVERTASPEPPTEPRRTSSCCAASSTSSTKRTRSKSSSSSTRSSSVRRRPDDPVGAALREVRDDARRAGADPRRGRGASARDAADERSSRLRRTLRPARSRG